MAFHIRRLFLNLAFYIVVWFFLGQLNFFAGWLSIHIPAYWIFVFFPVMTMDRREGIVLTLLCGVFLESRFADFRGILLPVFLGLFIYLQHRRSQLNDNNYRSLLWLASLSHLMIVLCMSGVLLLGGVHGSGYLLLRTLQDWATGQLALFVLLPVLWLGLLLLNGNSRLQNGYGEVS